MLRLRGRPGLIARGTFSERLSAAPLPAAYAGNAMQLGATGATTRFDKTGSGIPAGDFSVGFFLKIPSNVNATNVISNVSSTGTNPYSTNSSLTWAYVKATGRVSVWGLDASGNALGRRSPPLPAGNVNSNALVSKYPLRVGESALCVMVKTGNFAQLWMKFDGHAPVLCDESYTSFGAFNTNMWFGLGRDSANSSKLIIRNYFKVSYALTKAQIDAVGNGTQPETFGTPAVDDYRFPFNANGATITDAINGLTASRIFDAASIVTGVGLAPQADAVFMDPVGPEGYVFQHTNGSATVTLSGTYIGADADIEIQFLDFDNTPFQGWETIATGSGGTWSGPVSLPKGKRWIRAQLRKVGGTDVMTTFLKWGVGEYVMLSGQSLMEHMSSTGLPFSESAATPNGYVTLQTYIGAAITLAGNNQFVVTGMADNGSGLIRVTCSGGHPFKQNDEAHILGTVGTTESIGRWTVTPVSRTAFDLQGSTFTNSWVSDGVVYNINDAYRIMDNTLTQEGDGLIIIANAISNLANTVVAIHNNAVGGQSIVQFKDLGGTGINKYSALGLLAARKVNKLGWYLWLHGHADIGSTAYFSSGGSAGAWTGYGDLGDLYDLYVNNAQNNDFKFGLAAFTTVGGALITTSSSMQEFRFGMKDWVDRKRAAGNTNIFFTGFYNDMQPQWENSFPGNPHLTPAGYRSQAARLGHSVAAYLTGGSDARGPSLVSATRSGANIDLTITHNGGTDITWPRIADGSIPSGFECSTATNFGSLLTISNIVRLSATSIRITLSSDPGATVYVRYQYGRVGDYASNVYGTARVTGVADNGAGLIRVTCATSGLTPSSSQRLNTGHGFTTGMWGTVEGVRGATQANATWQFTRIDDTNVDLIGSSSAGLDAFQSGNLWQASATGLIKREIGLPIYDNRTIGGYDTGGAPLQPTYTYVTAV